MASPKLPFITYRIQDLDINTTREQLIGDFENAKIGPVQHVSLVKCQEGPRSGMTATITVRSTELRTEIGPTAQTRVLTLDNRMQGFTPLSRDESAADCVDIIAITGMGGKAFASWQCEDGSMWLRDVLPRDIPVARTHIYGYISDLQGRASTAGLEDYSNEFADLLHEYVKQNLQCRPLILVGHSLGCLVIKKMIVDAKEQFSDIFDRIHSVVFFGAPHRGLENEALLELLRGSWHERLISDLSFDSALLRHMNARFPAVSDKYKIISCIELQPTPTARAREDDPTKYLRNGPLKMMVDPQRSACLYTKNEEIIEIDKNHSQIAKLAAHDGAYTRVSAALKQHCTEAITYFNAKSNRKEAVRSAEAMHKITGKIALICKTRFGSTDRHTETFAELAKSFAAFRGFLDTAVCHLVLIDPARKPLGDVLMCTITQTLLQIEERFQMYVPLTLDGNTHVIKFIGGSAQRRPHSSLQDLFGPRNLSVLAETSRSALGKIKKLVSLAVTGSDVDELAKTATDPVVDFGKYIMQQMHIRADQWKNQQGKQLVGTLKEVRNSDIPQLGHVKVCEFVLKSNQQVSSPVLVEYRLYAITPQYTLTSGAAARKFEQEKIRRREQFARLAYVLENLWVDDGEMHLSATGRPQDTWNCTLRCLGYLDDREEERMALVFEMPKAIDVLHAAPQDLQTLRSLIDSAAKVKVGPRLTLQSRFKLARAVCESILRMHCWGWLHKDVRSDNFLLLQSTSEARSNTADNTSQLLIDQEPTYSAYLTGLEVARHTTDRTSGSETTDLEANLYRHPHRQDLPQRNFQKIHDIYAVGVVLLEVGLLQTMPSLFGRTIEKFANTGEKPTAEKIASTIRRTAEDLLPSKMGSQYTLAVLRCLDGEFGVRPDEQDRELSLQFQEMVLEVMEYGCHL